MSMSLLAPLFGFCSGSCAAVEVLVRSSLHPIESAHCLPSHYVIIQGPWVRSNPYLDELDHTIKKVRDPSSFIKVTFG